MDKIKSKADFQPTVSLQQWQSAWSLYLEGHSTANAYKQREYPQRDGKKCFNLCNTAHHTQLVRLQQERSTTVKTVIATSLNKPLVSIGSKHNWLTFSHSFVHSSLSLIFWRVQLGAKTPWLPKQNVSYSNILREGIQIAPASLD